jgi:hypothetical protein
VPTAELVWKDCYSGNQCARLKVRKRAPYVHVIDFLWFRQVPLDYFNPDAASAAIAMMRKHSIVPHNSTKYRGPILINPGGPGGSGVDLVAGWGARLSTILGPEFDFIGFDPRGGSLSEFQGVG